jgi:RNA polymerase sigma factor (sigma-70 family)
MNVPGPELLGQLLSEHAAALTLFARQWCKAPEDVVQEAFLRLAGQREPPREPAAWLFAVVRNGAISAGRAEARRRRHEAAAAEMNSDWFEVEDASRRPGDIDSQAAAHGLSRLLLEEREVIVAHIWGGLTFAQIAELVDSSASTVHRRYQAGLQALRNLLGEQCLPTTHSTKNYPQS